MPTCHLLTWLLLPGCLAIACGAGDGNPDAGLDGDGGDGPPQCQRWVLEDEVTNARDLGGHPLSGGQYVDCQKIFRGGDLKDLTRSGCSDFADLGILTVIDLRSPSYQQANPPAGCVATQAEVVSAPLSKLDPSAENYVALLQESESMATVFNTLANSRGYPVYIHCRIGRDRASTVAALVLVALGAERQTVIDEFKLNTDANVDVDPACMSAVLDEIDSLGGIQGYLSSIGISAAQIGTLKEQAIY